MLLNEFSVLKWNTNDENTLYIDVLCLAIIFGMLGRCQSHLGRCQARLGRCNDPT